MVTWTLVLAVAVLLVWWWQRRHRRRVPGGPIIHRAELEQAEREVRRMRAEDRVPVDDRDSWGPGAPRPPTRL
jgi:cyanate permease